MLSPFQNFVDRPKQDMEMNECEEEVHISHELR